MSVKLLSHPAHSSLMYFSRWMVTGFLDVLEDVLPLLSSEDVQLHSTKAIKTYLSERQRDDRWREDRLTDDRQRNYRLIDDRETDRQI